MRTLILTIIGVAMLAAAPVCAQELELLGADDASAAGPNRRSEAAGARAVYGELDRAASAFAAWRLAPWGDDVISLLGAGEHGHRETYVLEAGREYVFQAACDSNCDDVDIEVLDADGRSARRDTSQTIWPSVAVKPEQSARYTVRVWLTRCAVDYCYVGVRAYQSLP